MSHPDDFSLDTASLQKVTDDPLAFLQAMYQDALKAADPISCLPPHLDGINPKGRLIVLGAGKAAASMVQAVENTWQGEKEFEGMVITRYGYELPSQTIEILQASHPVPDAAGERGCARILDTLEDLTADDFIVFLISGGGSALLSMPVDAVSSPQKREINTALLKSGATIHEMNCVRKHLSKVKGGQLALAAHPARSLTLVISDVPGDDLDVIASGPTVPDHSTQKEALEVINKYNIDIDMKVRNWLCDPHNETPKPDNRLFSEHEVRIIASAHEMLERGRKFAKAHGLDVVVLGDDLQGEARDIAIEHIQRARAEAFNTNPYIILSGGEATVTIKGKGGGGGPNTEFILSAMIEQIKSGKTDPERNIYGIACDSDGIDGSEDNAGGYFTPGLIAAGAQHLEKLQDYLDSNNSYKALKEMDALYITGPTYTNVNDFRAILVI